MFGTALLSMRLVYEQTLLTWDEGWQMVGFSLSHIYPGLLILGMLSAICAHVCLIAFAIVIVVAKVRGRPVRRPNLLLVFALVFATSLLYVPYQAWMTLMVGIKGPGQHGNSLLSFAVAEHHPRLIKTLLDDGVPVDALYSGYTALNAACVGKDVEIGRYLLSREADLNRAPECEWVPEISGKPARIQVPGMSIDVK